ncbi:MAG: hypothetical protein JSS76_01495 [Bacteroidetes bacterium]|nr:hypothetical protein [Bacteroidota bacterium]
MNTQQEWFERGSQFAQSINEMLRFVQTHGWENWKGSEPTDSRTDLAAAVLDKLRAANIEGKVEAFRSLFPPSYAPFTQFLEANGQRIEQFSFIDNERIIFFVDSLHGSRTAYLLENDIAIPLDTSITSIGKSPKNNVFATASNDHIITTDGWQGKTIKSFTRTSSLSADITQIIPFNDGMMVSLLSPQGVFILSQSGDTRIFPEGTIDEEISLSMENLALSPNNDLLAIGDQDLQHTIIDKEGKLVASIGPQSSYPHFCLFSKDSKQFISNSCHFYNGTTIGVDVSDLPGLIIAPFKESDKYRMIDDNMRIYQGVSTENYYILGDAYGWIRAITKEGKHLWEYFIGSTITGMAISDDETTLWIGSYSGILHKLLLGKGHRDPHVIGTGDHYEAFRLFIWQNESQIWKW